MREELRDPSRLKHMIDSINNVNQYMDGKSESDLVDNSMLFFAIVKNIEIVGEAAYKLTHAFRETHPDTPWRQIIAMRHILVHGYFQVTPSEIYNVYKNDLPALFSQLQTYLTEISGSGGIVDDKGLESGIGKLIEGKSLPHLQILGDREIQIEAEKLCKLTLDIYSDLSKSPYSTLKSLTDYFYDGGAIGASMEFERKRKYGVWSMGYANNGRHADPRAVRPYQRLKHLLKITESGPLIADCLLLGRLKTQDGRLPHDPIHNHRLHRRLPGGDRRF